MRIPATAAVIQAASFVIAPNAARASTADAVVDAAIDWLRSTVFAQVSILNVELIVLWMAAPMLLLTFRYGWIRKHCGVAVGIAMGYGRGASRPSRVPVRSSCALLTKRRRDCQLDR